jgi:hypothetical protein
MLYTVKPLESIYAPPSLFNPNRKEKQEKKQENSEASAEAEYKEVPLPNGRIVTRREGENYIIERINSTDMKDYLNENYVPGKNYTK